MKSGIRTDPSDWTDERHRRGIAGEEQAIRYLLSRGCTIVAHRFRVGHTEIDLIARQGDLVTFVEVKTRRGEAFGGPAAGGTGGERGGTGEGGGGLWGPVVGGAGMSTVLSLRDPGSQSASSV